MRQYHHAVMVLVMQRAKRSVLVQIQGLKPQHRDCCPGRSRNFVGYKNENVDKFDWLAIVILPGQGHERRQIFIVPKEVARRRSYDAKHRKGRGFCVHKLIDGPPSPMRQALRGRRA
jgi:hypothetical protein